MAKNIIKKSFSNICISLALILICSLLISLFPHVMGYTPAQRLFFYDMLFKLTAGLSIVAAIGITSYHFIMQTELFFANKAARRVISVIIFALWAFFVLLWVFSSFFFRYFRNLYFGEHSTSRLTFCNSNSYMLFRRR